MTEKIANIEGNLWLLLATNSRKEVGSNPSLNWSQHKQASDEHESISENEQPETNWRWTN